ncbi:hypothetical protein SteCoe_12739 [Stentor coeruleus]|uniref:Uncharacterized protein n=1 Tax=Stentor coeruleus TaxID=5963 RepID=A0A1R2C9Z3_9CILI|nr:hypothetical protein SteCoe_12739 [Stentor coeruleus]
MEIRKKKARSNKNLIRILSSEKNKEAIKWSFSKAQRFKPTKREHTPDFNDMPSSLSNRACSFGYGKRWTPMNESGKDSPSPGTYEARNFFGEKNKGPSFQKKYTSKILNNAIPGPGSYTPYNPLGTSGPKFTFRKRMKNKIIPSSPPPDLYKPSYRMIENSSYNNIGFGIGQRSKIYGKLEESPGPGTYEIPSTFRAVTRESSSIFLNPALSKRARTPGL